MASRHIAGSACLFFQTTNPSQGTRSQGPIRRIVVISRYYHANDYCQTR